MADSPALAASPSAQKGLESTKHSIIDRANYLVFVAVAVTALVVGFCGVGIYYLTNMLAFQAKVLDAQGEALDNITANAANINNLRAGLVGLKENPSLLEVADTDAYREDPLLLVANALPVGENAAALGSNLTTLAISLGDADTPIESILPGASDVINEEMAEHETSALIMPFTLSATGNIGCHDAEYLCLEPLGLSKILWNFEHSTRAIYPDLVSLAFRRSGETSRIEMRIIGSGFYTQEKTFSVGSKTIRGGS